MKQLLTLIFSISILSISAQNGNWIFGWGVSVSWEGGSPNEGGPGPIFTAEGSASISDNDGNLLFSCDGINIYDKNGNVMMGGTGLMGDQSSTQNVLIAPRPFDLEQRYYHVFTVSAQDNLDGSGGLYHSVVDMEENNGLGAMITEPELLVPHVGEKIHATMHADGNRIWIVTHEGDSNRFHSFLLGCDGIQSENNVVSETGDVVDFYDTYLGAIGAMKISSDGTRIAMSHIIEVAPQMPGMGKLQTGSFNAETGEVIIDQILTEEGELLQGYGVEFSPNGQYVYWSIFGMTIRKILRYDLGSTDIPGSRYEVAVAQNGQSYAALQLAPDQKIYVARSNGAGFLSCINNPDEPIDADLEFVNVAITLMGLSTLGLPNDWNIDQKLFQDLSEYEYSLCEDQALILEAEYYDDAQYNWNSGHNSRTININQPGTYSVEIVHPCFSALELHVVNEVFKPEVTVSGALQFCEGEQTQIELITEEEIEWYDGDLNKLKTFTDEGSYSYSIYKEDCVFEETIELTLDNLPEISFSKDIWSICSGDNLILTPISKYADSIIWSDGTESLEKTISESGIYSVLAQNACGSTLASTEVLEEDCECDLYIPNAFSPNGDGINDLLDVVCACEIDEFKLEIFDRWGNLVFSTSDPNKKWDGGSGQGFYYPAGIYPYLISAEPFKNSQRRYISDRGYIQILR